MVFSDDKSRCLLVRKLHSIGVHVAQADDNFTDEEWTILMTGAENVFLKKGTPLVTQGQFNQFFFKLVSGALRVEKMQSNGYGIASISHVTHY